MIAWIFANEAMISWIVAGVAIAVLVLAWFVAGWMANVNASDDHDECHGK